MRLDGEKLTEGQVRTTPEDFAEWFQSLAAARVVMEVGTHSAWARDVMAGCGHEVLLHVNRQGMMCELEICRADGQPLISPPTPERLEPFSKDYGQLIDKARADAEKRQKPKTP